MKQVSFYIILCALLFPVLSVQAQVTTRNNVQLQQVQAKKEGNTVRIDMTVNLDNIDLGSAQMIILTPVLRSADKSKFHRFRPVVIMGAKRSRTIQRAIDFENFKFEDEPLMKVRYYNKRPQSIPLTLTAPYEEWQRGGEMYLQENKSGCAYSTIMDDETRILSPILPLLVEPVYELTYVTPPVEEVKQRSETHTARLNFEVGKHTILRNYKNNAEILSEVRDIISEVRGNKDLTVTDFQVTGYASPEGNEQSNMKLSENRAKAFVAYMTQNYNVPASSVKTDWRGEDWEGLRKVVSASTLSDKNEILRVLEESNVAQRKSKLKQLNGGSTYRMLLNEYYPPLRRNEYTVSFVARKFSVDEAKRQIQTRPQYLSLNEMFMVANTYPKNSKEFKEVFDIASRLYPNDPVAQTNAAAMDLENGATDAAIQKLQRIDTPEAWNNLGIAYAQKGDYQKAEEYFKRASQRGHQAAATNMKQLSDWINAK